MTCQCSGVCWLIGICILQLVTIAVRQTFDFLGLQWTAIVVNFCQMLGVILGLVGACRRKPRLVAVYSAWALFWLGWNIFVVFLYFGVGALELKEHLIAMNLGLSNMYSWFKVRCVTADEFTRNTTAALPLFCAINFSYFEVGQSTIQLLLAVFGFSLSCYVVGILREDDSFDFQDITLGASSMQKHRTDSRYYPHRQPLVGQIRDDTNG